MDASSLQIKLATEKDLMDVFNLSNDPEVRKSSFNSKDIKLEDHKKWFINKINSPDCIFYIVKDNMKNFIGQVRFDEVQDKEFVIGISINKSFRGKGLGSLIIKVSSDKIIKENNANKIYAYIKKENNASLKSFLRADYIIDNEEIINGIKASKLKYERS